MKQVKARVKNLINRGICLTTDEPLGKGKVLTLEISYDVNKKLIIRGKVMWSLEIESRFYESGIDFLFMNVIRKEELTQSLN